MQGGNVGESSTPDRVQGRASDSQMFLGWLSGSFLSIQGKSPVMAAQGSTPPTKTALVASPSPAGFRSKPWEQSNSSFCEVVTPPVCKATLLGAPV